MLTLYRATVRLWLVAGPWHGPGRKRGTHKKPKFERADQMGGLRRRLGCVERLGARGVAGSPQLHVSGCGLLLMGWLGPGWWAGIVLEDVWAGHTPRFGHALESRPPTV